MTQKRRIGIWPLALMAVIMMGHGAALFAENTYSASKKGLEAYDKQDYEKALDHYIKAQLDAPDDPEVAYNLGNAQYKNGNYDDALNQFRQALKTSDPELRQAIHYNMGNSYFRKNDFEKALSEYEEALKMNADDQDARKNADFVKKVMEEQQKKPKQDNDSQKDDQNDKKQDGKQKGKDTPKDSGSDKSSNHPAQSGDQKTQPDQKHDEKAGDGNRKDDQGEKPSENQPPPSQKDPEQDHETAQGASKDEGQKTDGREMEQAQRMLNRLKDMPGKALIPSYEPRQVDKDW